MKRVMMTFLLSLVWLVQLGGCGNGESYEENPFFSPVSPELVSACVGATASITIFKSQGEYFAMFIRGTDAGQSRVIRRLSFMRQLAFKYRADRFSLDISEVETNGRFTGSAQVDGVVYSDLNCDHPRDQNRSQNR